MSASASDRLATTNEPVSALARALGYASESAFSTAFKRVTGSPPRVLGRRHGTAARYGAPGFARADPAGTVAAAL